MEKENKTLETKEEFRKPLGMDFDGDEFLVDRTIGLQTERPPLDLGNTAELHRIPFGLDFDKDLDPLIPEARKKMLEHSVLDFKTTPGNPYKDTLTAIFGNREDPEHIAKVIARAKGVLGKVGDEFGYNMGKLSDLIPDELVESLPKIFKVEKFYNLYEKTVNENGQIKPLKEIPLPVAFMVANLQERTDSAAKEKYNGVKEINPILRTMEKLTSELDMFDVKRNKDNTVTIKTASGTEYRFHEMPDTYFTLIEAKGLENGLFWIDSEAVCNQAQRCERLLDSSLVIYDPEEARKSGKKLLNSLHLAEGVPTVEVSGVTRRQNPGLKIEGMSRYEQNTILLKSNAGMLRIYSGLKGAALAIFKYSTEKEKDEFYIINDKNLKKMIKDLPLGNFQSPIPDTAKFYRRNMSGEMESVRIPDPTEPKLKQIFEQSLADMKYSTRLGEGSLGKSVRELRHRSSGPER